MDNCIPDLPGEDTASGGGPEVRAVPMDVTPADRIARLQARAQEMAERARAQRLARNRDRGAQDDEQ